MIYDILSSIYQQNIAVSTHFSEFKTFGVLHAHNKLLNKKIYKIYFNSNVKVEYVYNKFMDLTKDGITSYITI